MRYSLRSCGVLVAVVLSAGPLAGAEAGIDLPDAGPGWLAMGEQMAQAAGEAPSAAPAGVGTAIDPAAVRGPAQPGDVWRSLGRDAKDFLPMMWADTQATATSPLSLICLGLAGAGGIALSGNNGNDQVQRHFERHDGINHFWDNVGDVGGNPGLHFAVAGAMYFTGQIRRDTKTYEVSKTMLSALALNGIATMALKVASRTESPNGDEFGWPSGHTSSSFCMATVLHESYGPWVGIPAFAFAAYVGYERIDARNHDFADVISGALIGIAIGHAVAKNHELKVLGMDVVPYSDPQRGGFGLALLKRF